MIKEGERKRGECKGGGKEMASIFKSTKRGHAGKKTRKEGL
jgi:hypothetical protein